MALPAVGGLSGGAVASADCGGSFIGGGDGSIGSGIGGGSISIFVHLASSSISLPFAHINNIVPNWVKMSRQEETGLITDS